METYCKDKITKTYFTILVLDASGDIYDEITKDIDHKEFTNIINAAKCVINMMKTDKELGEELGGKWSYRIGKHEEDDDTDWQTIYKLYKYKGKWKYKVDEKF